MRATTIRQRVIISLALYSFFFYSSALAAPAVYYFQHPDHLGSQGVTTDQSGRGQEIVDYFPFGSPRTNDRFGSFQEQRKYGGEAYDPGSGLSFYEQRVLNGKTGNFLSQDSRFLNPTEEELVDPQRLHAYRFARNNPLRYIDEKGAAARDFQRSIPTVPAMSNRGFPVLLGPNRPAYTFRAGDSMGTYKGVPLFSNGMNQGTGDGLLSYQCVGFVKNFYASRYGIHIGRVGSAGAMSDTAFLNHVTRSTADLRFVGYSNGEATSRPRDDDMIGWQGGKYGHVGVVVSVYFDEKANRGFVDVAEQNWGTQASQTGLSRHTLTRNPDTGVYRIADRGSYRVSNWSRLESTKK